MLEAAARSGHTGIPIYGADREHVIGLARVEDALKVARADRDSMIVTCSAADDGRTRDQELPSLLSEMRAARVQFAVVVDEYGGFAGIVTDEDLLEEIVGEIQEGLSEVGPTRAPGLLPGTAHHDQVLDGTGFPMPDEEGDYATLAGFILSRLGHIPTWVRR